MNDIRFRRIELIRKAIAKYIKTEGCGCCVDFENHANAERELGKLVGAKRYRYTNGSGYGYDFNKKAKLKEEMK